MEHDISDAHWDKIMEAVRYYCADAGMTPDDFYCGLMQIKAHWNTLGNEEKLDAFLAPYRAAAEAEAVANAKAVLEALG